MTNALAAASAQRSGQLRDRRRSSSTGAVSHRKSRPGLRRSPRSSSRRDPGALLLQPRRPLWRTDPPVPCDVARRFPNVGSRPSARARAPCVIASLFAFGGPPMRAAHGADRIHRDAGRQRPVQSDRHGVRARRPALRVPSRAAGCASSRTARCCRRRFSPSPSTRRRARAARRRVRPGLRRRTSFVYVYYTATTPADPQPHQPLHRQRRRRGGRQRGRASSSSTTSAARPTTTAARMHFGPDGKLYVAVGENANGANAQTLGNLLGKMLRINADGTIPTDNPFYGTATGKNRAIWALGLRNPFTFAFQPGTGRMFINDVGQNTWEEINDGIAGANYGWPDTEGATTDPRFAAPLYAYNHGTATPAARSPAARSTTRRRRSSRPTTSATTSSPTTAAAGSASSTRRPATPSSTFATGIASPGRPAGRRRRQPLLPRARRAAASSTGSRTRRARRRASRSTRRARRSRRARRRRSASRASGTAPLALPVAAQRRRTSPARRRRLHARRRPRGRQRRALPRRRHQRLRQRHQQRGDADRDARTSRRPATITAPAAGTLYSGGRLINYAGTAPIPRTAPCRRAPSPGRSTSTTTRTRTRSFRATSGATSGSFTIPTTGETATNVWYRIYLTVRDSGGLTHTTLRDVAAAQGRT